METNPSPAPRPVTSQSAIQPRTNIQPAGSQIRPNVQPTANRPQPQTFSLDEIIRTMVGTADGVSDLLFVVGRLPQVEIFGKLTGVEIPGLTPALQPAHVEAIAGRLMAGNERLASDFKATGSCDTSYSVADLARFRVNIFRQNGNHAIVMRKLSTKIPSLEGLGLPPIFQEMIKEKTGLIFVTGATGSGKTTTLAAMLNELNQNHEMHVVTLEDPIEFLHPHARATFSQREFGKDFSDFAVGLRAALRQAPKVILVGEIRDRDTMEIALTAAETGHVVFSTLHTISAAQSINRVIGMFSHHEEEQIRQRLADTLRFVVSQRLAPKVGGGRVMASEIMGSNLRTREAIQLGENEVRNFHEIVESGFQNGWHSFEQDLVGLFKTGKITEETAVTYSVNKSAIRRALDIAKKDLGTDDASSHGFRLNVEALHVKAPPPRQAPPPLPGELALKK
jgi:twitching motility protein PilT